MDRIPAPATPPTEKMPLHKPPPDVTSTDRVLQFTATEPDELVFNTDTDEVRHRRKVTFV